MRQDGKGDYAPRMANVWIRLNSSPFDDVSVPNCALRSAAVTIVDKNLRHIIAAGHSFRVAARRTIIIVARSRRSYLPGCLICLLTLSRIYEIFYNITFTNGVENNLWNKIGKRLANITVIATVLKFIFFGNYIVKYFLWG